MKYFWDKIMTEKLLALCLLISVLIVVILPMMMPIMYKQIIDTLTNTSLSRPEIISNVFGIFAQVVMILAGIWVWWRLLEIFIVRFEIWLMWKVMRQCFDYIHAHSYRFFTDNFAGSLVKKVNRLVKAMEGIIDIFLFEIIRLVVTAVFVCIVVSLQNIYLGTVFGIWILLFLIISYYLQKRVLPYRLKEVEQDSRVSWVMVDTFTNHFTISIFGAYHREKKFFRNTVQAWQNTAKSAWYRQMVVYGVLSTISVIMEWLMLYVALRVWSEGMITVWVLVLLLTYQIYVTSLLFSISHIFRRMYVLISDSWEAIELLDKPHEIQNQPDAKDMLISAWHIQFQNVDFAYNDDNYVFQNLNLDIPAWQKVALVWVSGSGKSTIVKLLFRFFDINSGKILIDGQNISAVKQNSLRANISMVPQEPILFHRTLYENIAYGRPHASHDEVIQASKLAHCHDFIQNMPYRYDTLVWERWVKLSGWERQRVAIARVLLEQSKILVMDEATSSLDSESEHLIQDAMYEAMGDKTTLVIAHRLSTIMKMDRIIVLEQWKIIEDWTHEQLLQADWVYSKLWQIQSWGFLTQ